MGILVSDYDIMVYLNNKNISPANLGYGYLRKAIKLATVSADYLYKIITLYTQVADDSHSTYQRVERAIRHSIEISGTKVKNRVFIADAVNHFEMESARIQKENSAFNIRK
jgi:hypothetical protein